MIFAKAAAVLKKDILTSVRYRSGFFLKLVSPALQLATFYYLARAVGPQFRPDGMPYAVFLIVGTGFYTFLVTGIHSFLQTIQDSQHRNQSPADPFTDGGRDRRFFPALAEAAPWRWPYGFRIHLGRRPDAK